MSFTVDRTAARHLVREYWLLALLMTLALSVRLLWRAHFMSGPGLDGVEYVDLADGFLGGRGYGAVSGRRTEFVAPLFPVLATILSSLSLDAISTTGGALRAVSVAFGTLLVLPVWLITKRLYGVRTAHIAGLAVATYPLLVHLSAIASPDILCLTFVAAALYCQLRLPRSAAWYPAFFAGVFYGLAIVTRPEAVLVLAATCCVTLVSPGGSWAVVARNTATVLISSMAIVAAGAALVIASGGEISTRVFAATLGELPSGATLAALQGFLQGFSFPLLLALAAIGLFRSPRAHARGVILLASALATSALALEATRGPIGLAAGALTVVLIWSSNGIAEIGRVFTASLPHVAERPTRRLVHAAVAVGAIVSITISPYRTLVGNDGTTRLAWDVGWWLAKAEPSRKRVMDTSQNAALQAGAGYVPFPTGDSQSALDAIGRSEVDYLVLRREHTADRPYLEEWFNRGVPHARARLTLPNHFSDIRSDREGYRDVLVYEWLRDEDDGQRAPVSGQRSHDRPRVTGPLRVSAANPRYFADAAGNPVYLTGFHAWPNLQDAGRLKPVRLFDFDDYLSRLQAHRVNFIRLWAWEQANWVPWRPYDFQFSPLPYARVGPGQALDGKLKFDLTRLDDEYLRRLRDRVAAADAQGIYVSVMLFQGWSVAKDTFRDYGWGDPWAGHPFNRHNNVNGVDGDPDTTGEGRDSHTLRNRHVLNIQERYVEKVIDTLNDLDNVLFEICNECHGASLEWQSHLVRFIQTLESRRPKQHPVGMTAMYPGDYSNRDLFRSPADWISPLAAGGYLTDPPAAEGTKVVIADTDHLWGLGGDREWAWKSFVRGLNPIFMDAYDHEWMYSPGGDSLNPKWDSLRKNLGYTADYAARIDLRSMVPRGDLCSTSFCLARPDGAHPEDLMYIPNGGRAVVDLTASLTELDVEWFHPATGRRSMGVAVKGGGLTEFVAPFYGDVVLYLSAAEAVASAHHPR